MKGLFWNDYNKCRRKPIFAAALFSLLGLLPLLLSSCGPLPFAGGEPLQTWFPFTDTFESGATNARWHREVARDDAISLVTPPAGSFGSNVSAKALFFAVKPGDVVNNGNRAEAAIYNCGQYQDTMYYAWDFLIPSGDPDSFDWQIIAQWYQLPDFERGEEFEGQYPHPPVTIVAIPGKIEFKTTIPDEYVVKEMAVAKDTWYRIVVAIHFDTDKDGWVQAWFGLNNGSLSQMFSDNYMVATLLNKAGIYWKLGLYRGYVNQTQATGTNSIYVDNVKIGRSLVEVQ